MLMECYADLLIWPYMLMGCYADLLLWLMLYQRKGEFCIGMFFSLP